ncbi:hypothetical protein Tco_1398570, partial [Tanacetum coccineum]
DEDEPSEEDKDDDVNIETGEDEEEEEHPEEPEQAPPLPDYVPGPKHVDDEIVAEDQPYAEDASPTARSPDYVPMFDLEADPEEDDDEDPEEDPDDDMDIEADDDEEEEEHPAPADSVVVALPAADQVSSAEETEPFETDKSAATPPPHPAYRVTARISIPAPVPTPVWSDAEVDRLLAISTPPSSPLSPWSSPLPQIPSPPLPVSPLLPISSLVLVLSPSPPASPIRPLGYRAAMIRLRAEAVSTSYSLPLPPPLHLLSTDRREDRPKVTLPPRKRLGIALGPAYEVGESSSAAAARPAGGLRADYGFVATMDREIRRDPKRDVGYGITDLCDEIVETLTRMRFIRGSMDASDLARAEVMSLRTTVLAQQSQIRELQSADRRRQTMISEMLAADHRRQKQLIEALKLIKRLQTQMAEFERQQGPAKGPAQPELPEEAGSSS